MVDGAAEDIWVFCSERLKDGEMGSEKDISFCINLVGNNATFIYCLKKLVTCAVT